MACTKFSLAIGCAKALYKHAKSIFAELSDAASTPPTIKVRGKAFIGRSKPAAEGPAAAEVVALSILSSRIERIPHVL